MKRLTLYMDKAVVKNAKKIAKKSRMSLSKVVREYFRVAAKADNIMSLNGIPPVVMSMIGILRDDGKTYKEIREEYYQHIEDKYNKRMKADTKGGVK
jgi:hypothetical protein